MSTIVCPRCQRVNPDFAVYCHFDGIVLNQNYNLAGPVPGTLPQPFVFPSHRSCSTMQELAQGILDEWEESRRLLKKGRLRQYFTSIGRADLARAADESAQQPDADIALHHFLSNFPVDPTVKPKLDLKPRRLSFSTIRPGEVREVPLQIFNLGQGDLQGKLKVAEGSDWLQIEGASTTTQTLNTYRLQKKKQQEITLRIDTRGLPAPNSYSARIHAITNGGISEIPIRLDLGAIPFAHAPFKGARTQRELAEKMVKKPKAAVPLLENGEIQRWFAANGWSYPIQGAPARGVAAVQQFFEGMGLSKPPRCKLTETEVYCMCVPPEVGEYQVLLRTSAKKWIYGQVESDSLWLRVLNPEFSGAQKAAINFEVDSSLMDPGLHEGMLTIVANAGQIHQVRVEVDVRPPHVPFTRRLLKPFFSIGLIALFYRLLFLLPGDIYARLVMGTSTAGQKGSLQFWSQPAIDEQGEFLRSFTLATLWIGTVVGLFLLRKKGSRARDMVSGAIAGTMAGVVGAVTFASLVTLIDSIPRWLLTTLFSSDTTMSLAVATLLWLGLALASWMVVGGVVGFVLTHIGKWGRHLVAMLAAPFKQIFRSLGMDAPTGAPSAGISPLKS